MELPNCSICGGNGYVVRTIPGSPWALNVVDCQACMGKTPVLAPQPHQDGTLAADPCPRSTPAGIAPPGANDVVLSARAVGVLRMLAEWYLCSEASVEAKSLAMVVKMVLDSAKPGED